MRSLIKSILNQFTMITTGTLFGAAFTISWLYDDLKIRGEVLWQILILSFLTACLILVFYSKKELSKKQYVFRMVIHYISVNCILIVGGRRFGWIELEQNRNLPVFIIVIAIIYIVIAYSSYLRDRKTSQSLNHALVEYRQRKCDSNRR